MVKAKVKRRLVSKGGSVIEAGDIVDVSMYSGSDGRVILQSDGCRIIIRSDSCYDKLEGFMKEPSMRVLGRWVDDGIAKSIRGKRVEPDGHDSDGFPSWLLVLGII